MSDSRLRALGRMAGADPASRVAYLRARVRAGTLEETKLWLAAHLGDEAARKAHCPVVRVLKTGYTCCCGDVDCSGWSGHTLVHACEYYKTECTCEIVTHMKTTEVEWPTMPLERWAERALYYVPPVASRDVAVRVCVRMAELGLDATGDHEGCEGAHTDGLDCAGADAVIQATREYLDREFSDSAVLRATVATAHDALTPRGPWHALWSSCAASVASGDLSTYVTVAINCAAQLVANSIGGVANDVSVGAIFSKRKAEAERRVREAIRDELVPWALR